MALLTAYLAHTARRKARRATVTAARTGLDRIGAFIRSTRQALSEAQELRRSMTEKYPFTDM